MGKSIETLTKQGGLAMSLTQAITNVQWLPGLSAGTGNGNQQLVSSMLRQLGAMLVFHCPWMGPCRQSGELRGMPRPQWSSTQLLFRLCGWAESGCSRRRSMPRIDHPGRSGPGTSAGTGSTGSGTCCWNCLESPASTASSTTARRRPNHHGTVCPGSL
jgi:hypothetical protein